MTLYSYSQSTYPKRMLIDGDTVVAITVEQSKKVNKTFLEKNYYKTVTESLGKKVTLLEMNSNIDYIIINKLKVQIDNLNLIISNKQKAMDKQKEDLDATDRELKKSKRKNRFKKVGLGMSIAANIVLSLLIATGR